MALPDVILEEIFLRLPPDEPESLVRASLASKLWLGRLTSAAFHGRYREFHGDPPMLGFLFSSSWGNDRVPKLASTTTKFCGRIPPDDGWAGLKYDTRECRHGRVLLVGKKQVTVWNPMTGRRSVVDTPGKSWSTTAAAVLCGVAGCDHSVCHDRPFRVVLVVVDRGVARACVSSPDTGEWSKPCRGLELGDALLESPSVLVRGGLYYKFTYFPGNDVYILKYDLASDCLSAFEAPAGAGIADQCMLMAMQDCSLGFASLSHDSILHYWSRQMLGSDGGGSAASSSSWTQRGSIHLKSFLPVQIHTKLLMLMGSAEGSDIVFVVTGPGFTTDHDGIYQINLNSLHWKKIWKGEGFVNLLPYMSFYHPRGVLEQARSAM